MHTATRPFATAGVSLIGAAAIAMTPVLAPTVGTQIQRVEAQVEQVAVQLTAAGDPFAEFGKLYQDTLSNIGYLLSGQLPSPSHPHNPTPIFTQFITNQLTALQDLLKLVANPGSLVVDPSKSPGVPFNPAPPLLQALNDSVHGVFTNLTTAVPPLLQSAFDELLHGQIEAGNNQLLLAAMTAIIPLTNIGTPLLNTIAYPLQGLVSFIDQFGPLGAIIANPLQNAVNALNAAGADLENSYSVSNLTTLIGGLIGPLITTPAAIGAAAQHILDAAHSGNFGKVITAVLNAPATVIGGFLNGGYGPDLQHLIDTGFPGIGVFAGGLLGSLALNLTDPLSVNLPGPFAALQSVINAIANALKPPAVKAAPKSGARSAAAELPDTNATTIALAPAGANGTAGVKRAHRDRHAKTVTETVTETGAKTGSDNAGDQTGPKGSGRDHGKRHDRDHGKGLQGSNSSSSTKPAKTHTSGNSSNHHNGGGHGGHGGHTHSK